MNDSKFAVRCDASPSGHLEVVTQALSVAVSQSVNRGTGEEMWQSVLVICEESEGGVLTTKVIICHPDWEQNLQIASIRSCRSNNGNPAPPLEIDLKSAHV